MIRFDEQESTRSSAACCEIAADAVVRASLESLPELRRNPGPTYGEPLPASFLKHADDQTVAALCAVYQAIREGGLQETDFRDWGVLSAPRFLGRATMAAALQRFAAEGAWGVSPHLIPHRSLHSISGTISQALKIHGPNFGVGGGPEGTVEVLLAALALLEGKRLPGVWIVLTCLDPELPPDEAGRLPAGTQAVGLALALTPLCPAASLEASGNLERRLRLRITPGTPDDEILTRPFDLPRFETLLHRLHESHGDTTIVQLLDHHSRLELVRRDGASSNGQAARTGRRPHFSADTDNDPGRLALADH